MLYLANFADEPLDDFSDLEPALTEVPPEENGFKDILASLDAMESSPDFEDIDAIEKFTVDDIKLFQEFYTNNQANFASLHSAIASNFIQEAISYDMASEYHVMHLIQVSNILTIEIKFHIAKNDINNALRALNSQTQLGEKCLTAEGALVPHLVALPIVSEALENQYSLLSREQLLSRHLIPHPQLHESINNSFAMAMNIEWAIYSATLDTHIDGNINQLTQNEYLRYFMYQPNKTRNNLAEMLRLTKRIHAAPFTKKQAIIDDLDMLHHSSSSIITGNYIGEALLDLMGPVTYFTPSNHYSIILKNRSLHLLFSLRHYSNDHGDELPDNLAELVPQYIASIPLDPFNGEPLLYSKKKKLIWSVGSDLKDNLGVSVETLSTGELDPLESLTFEDEPHLEIPF